VFDFSSCFRFSFYDAQCSPSPQHSALLRLSPNPSFPLLTSHHPYQKIETNKFPSHRWNAEQKEWIPESTKYLQESQNKNKNNNPKPHVPRSLQGEENPKAGLGNLLNVL